MTSDVALCQSTKDSKDDSRDKKPVGLVEIAGSIEKTTYKNK